MKKNESLKKVMVDGIGSYLKGKDVVKEKPDPYHYSSFFWLRSSRMKSFSKNVNLFFVFCLVFVLTSCVTTKSADILIDEKIDFPKTIAVSGTRASWVYEIEKRLIKKGFKIKRMASQHVSIQQVNPNKVEVYSEASSRFILHIDGYAPNNIMERCFAGGYRFDYINVELVDVSKNETVLHYSNSGYSEGCPPMSGTIFTDIENMLNSLWK